LSNVNVETLSRLQREDPTLSNCRLKALNNVDESKDVKFAFYYENNVNGPTISIAILLNGSLMIGVFTIGTLTLSLFDVL
jgi:hypothetical protein